jgi:putative phosphoribosyl transferase
MIFRDREEAGRQLAATLERMKLGPCVVAGIPRGGMIVAAPVARQLGAPLVAVHARKLALPGTDIAFGAIDEDGHVVLDYRATVTLGLGTGEVEEVKEAVRREMAWPLASTLGPRLGAYLPDRTVVIVDDGLLTGLTMQAAIAYARRHGAMAVVAAAPCASERAAYEVGSLLGREEDHFVCLRVDLQLGAIRDSYEDFRLPSEKEVEEVSRRTSGAAPSPARPRPVPGIP